MSDETLQIDGHEISLSNRDKPLFAKDDTSKCDRVSCCRRVADIAIRHHRARPPTKHRFPDGIDGDGFFQMEAPNIVPTGLNGRY